MVVSKKTSAVFTNTQNPRRNNICSHLFSIIPGKESSQGTGDKIENEVINRQTKTSTDK